MIGDRTHLDVVAEHETVVSELLTQQAHDLGRQGRGSLRVELGKQDVGRHHAGDLGLDGRSEGGQLDPLHALEVEVEAGQGEVAVEVGVAVTGEMFCTGRHAQALHGRDKGPGVGADRVRVTGEAAVADHRVVRVAVDVDHRREVEVEATVEQLQRQGAGEAARVGGIAAAQAAHGRPLGPGIAQPLDTATLLVEGHGQGGICGGEGVEVADQAADLPRVPDVALEQDHTADPPLADPRAKIGGDLQAVKTDKQELARVPLAAHGRRVARRPARGEPKTGALRGPITWTATAARATAEPSDAFRASRSRPCKTGHSGRSRPVDGAVAGGYRAPLSCPHLGDS